MTDLPNIAAASSAHSGRSRRAKAMGDLVEGLRLRELWATLGWHDIRQRYRRSLIGPFWLTLSMGAMIGGLAYLYAGLFHQDIRGYLPYVATGMIVFSLISAIASESAMTFIGSSSLILQLHAPLSVYIYQMLWRNLLIFLHNISIYVLIVIFVGVQVNWCFLLAPIGLFLLMLNGLWVGIILGGLSARFRDIPPIINSVMQIAFFLTPVFWRADSLSGRAIFVHFNPLYYLVEVVRMPLLGQAPPLQIWAGVLALNLVSFVIAIALYPHLRARVAYWV